MGIVGGRIPRGVAVLWNKKLDLFINAIRLALTDALPSSLFCNNEFFILYVCTPYKCNKHLEEYLKKKQPK